MNEITINDIIVRIDKELIKSILECEIHNQVAKTLTNIYSWQTISPMVHDYITENVDKAVASITERIRTEVEIKYQSIDISTDELLPHLARQIMKQPIFKKRIQEAIIENMTPETLANVFVMLESERNEH